MVWLIQSYGWLVSRDLYCPFSKADGGTNTGGGALPRIAF